MRWGGVGWGEARYGEVSSDIRPPLNFLSGRGRSLLLTLDQVQCETSFVDTEQRRASAVVPITRLLPFPPHCVTFSACMRLLGSHKCHLPQRWGEGRVKKGEGCASSPFSRKWQRRDFVDSSPHRWWGKCMERCYFRPFPSPDSPSVHFFHHERRAFMLSQATIRGRANQFRGEGVCKNNA